MDTAPPFVLVTLFDQPPDRLDTLLGPVQVTVLRAVAELHVRSTLIVAGDPHYVAHDEPPFDVPLPTGRHPVDLALVTRRNGDERIAAARVRVADHATAQLEAVRSGAVDSGVWCFVDADAKPALQMLDTGFEPFWASLSAAMEPTYRHTRSWGSVEVPEAGGLNVVAMDAGDGDGEYLTFAGRDAAGSLVAIVSDFGLLDTAADRPPGVKTWWQFWR